MICDIISVYKQRQKRQRLEKGWSVLRMMGAFLS